MLLYIYEIFTILMLLIATISGVFALNSLGPNATHYKITRLFNPKVPPHLNKHLRRFLLYTALALSTSSSFLAMYLRIIWLSDMGWDDAGNEWAFWWLTSHSIDAFVYTAVHILVYMKFKRQPDT